MVNIPIQEGFSAATAKKSFAELQFENGSTVRLGELTGVDFPTGWLGAGGTGASTGDVAKHGCEFRPFWRGYQRRRARWGFVLLRKFCQLWGHR